MISGDLDNHISRRVLIIFENTLARLPKNFLRKESRACKAHRWEKALSYWEFDWDMVSQIWNMYLKYDLRCDLVVTTRPSGFSAEVYEYVLDYFDLPVRKVLTAEVDELNKMLPRMPDVHTVVYCDPALQGLFGLRGTYLERPGQALRL